MITAESQTVIYLFALIQYIIRANKQYTLLHNVEYILYPTLFNNEKVYIRDKFRGNHGDKIFKL